MRRFLIAAALMAGAVAPGLAADSGWFESGDTVLRLDLQLLNDAGVIRLPVTQWPLPHAALEHAVSGARAHLATNAAVSMALARVRARVAAAPVRYSAGLMAGDAGLLRDFDTLGRENAEARASADIARTFSFS